MSSYYLRKNKRKIPACHPEIIKCLSKGKGQTDNRGQKSISYTPNTQGNPQIFTTNLYTEGLNDLHMTEYFIT